MEPRMMAPQSDSERSDMEDRRQMLRMRTACLVEGGTLILLLFVAVPLKHFAGFPDAVKAMGPIHGFAFLTYLWMLVRMVSAGGWSRGETIKLFVAAMVPFGAFFSARTLTRRAALASTL
jgi:integral membrane protein